MFQAIGKRHSRNTSRGSRAPNRRTVRLRRFALEALEARLAMTGTWTPLANSGPSYNIGTMELMTDGSVMIFTSPNSNFKLTPNSNGSYINGTFSAIASMGEARLYDATNVLKDGRVLVLGGRYTTGSYVETFTNTGEIYNPLNNSWTNIPSFPEEQFGPNPTMLLPDGRVLAGSKTGPSTYIYDPNTNAWSTGPTRLRDQPSWGTNWIKLPDGDILSYDIWASTPTTQRLDTDTMTWVDSGTLPVAVQNPGKSTGPGLLLPDGRVFQLGQNSNTALYTPASTPGGTGVWESGPVLPDGLGARLSTAAILPNGRVLFAAGPGGTGYGPIRFFEFNPSDNSLTDVTPTTPDPNNWATFITRMLVLPSGQVLMVTPQTGPDGLTGQLYVYTPDGAPDAAWKPSITSVVANGSNVYTLTGTQLNGLSAGAMYSYGAEMDTNYPIVQLTNAAGKVYYARSYNWSSTGVATGSTPVTTQFSLPAGLPSGTYSLRVIANGIASNPVSFTGGFTGADLGVMNSGPAAGVEGNNLSYTIKVTNFGPSNATGVVVNDTLGANLGYVSASVSQGSFKRTGNDVKYTIGNIAVGQTVTLTVTAQSLDYGNLTNTAVVVSSTSDSNSSNNTQAFTTAVAAAPIVVSGPISVSGKKQTNITVATFTHASGVHAASYYTATINWGDGSISTGTISKSGTTFTVKGSYTYATNGTRSVTTTVVPAGTSALRSAAFVSNPSSTQAISTSKSATQKTGQTAARSGTNTPKLKAALVDKALNVGPIRRSPALHSTAVKIADELFSALFV